MESAEIQIIHEAIAEAVEAARSGDDATAGERWMEAANLSLMADGIEEKVIDKTEAVQVLQNLERNLAEDGRYLDVAVLLWGNGMFDSRPNGVRQIFEAVQKNSKLLIMGCSSVGKCLGPDVPVLMFNGEIKKSKDVKVGDLLMGDDSTPRRVLVANSGHGPMYKITPERGEPWTCNDAHILSLKVNSTRICGNSRRPSKQWVKGGVKDVPLMDYLKMGVNSKGRLKQFHVRVDFPVSPLPFDPYIYGAWLGDGGFDSGTLHTPVGPMSRRWMEYWSLMPGMRVTKNKSPNRCAVWRVCRGKGIKRNLFLDFIRTSRSAGEKKILQEYLINGRENRLKLLAGLLDSDGWLEHGRCSYGFVAKSEGLARQVCWLARSLGFASTVRPKKCQIRSIGFSRIYWSVRVSGAGISEIPCLEKPARESTSLKNMTCTGFTVEPIGSGEYHGFVIDGNHRFLLGDMTVTHNTFVCGVLFYLFWRQDSYWTAVKLAAPSEDHLYTNLFSHLVALHRGAVIPMTDDDATKVKVNETDLFISMTDALPEMRIQGVLCRISNISAGAMRGHKPKPYRKPDHPKYGNSTRLFILIDEASQVSPGAFEDLRTTEASIDEKMDNVKIVIAFNPEEVSDKVVRMAEPEEGWDVEQVDTLYSWTSKQGYPVLRLDGARFENVIERRVIYPRMLTYEAFLSFLKAGEHSGVYWAKGRGFPPLADSSHTIIPPAWMSSQRGEPIYVSDVKHIASLDTALGGGDKALLGVGRWGEAAGWRDYRGGEPIWFVNRANPDQKITKHVLVVDQIFQLPKSNNTVDIISEVMGRCKQMQVPVENVSMDRGGNAAGVWSHATKYWGNVLGVDSGERASEEKILSDDLMVAYDVYQLKVSELFYAAFRWLDPVVCALLINPTVPTQPLFTQMTTRRYRTGKGGKLQVEPKHEFRLRNQGASPDECDIVLLMVEWCRQRGGFLPGIMERKTDENSDYERVSIKNADEPDTLETNAAWTSNRLDS